VAPDDYNKKKKLEVTSQNDSGTTQDKAQPILVKGENIDGFESGSSVLGWENTSGFTIDTNSEITGNNSLQANSSNASVSESKAFNTAIDDNFRVFQTQVKIDNQTGNSGDRVNVRIINGTGQQMAQVGFAGDGNIEVEGEIVCDTGTGWSAGTIYELLLVFDFSPSKYNFDVVLNGTTICSNVGFGTPSGGSISAGEAAELYLENDTTSSGSTVNAFFDEQNFSTYNEKDGITGDIVVDFSNIAGPEDIAVYDQNDNLLDYEIEELDTTAETATLWCYNSWTRDDTVQAQIVYGDNSANTDNQNAAGTWANNNGFGIYHLNGDATDSSGNSYDGTLTGTTTVSGQFSNALDFDGVDDQVNIGDVADFDFGSTTDYTFATWIKTTQSGTTGRILNKQSTSDFDGYQFKLNSDGTINFQQIGGAKATNQSITSSSSVNDDNWHYIVVTTNRSAGSATMWIDGSQEASAFSWVQTDISTSSPAGIAARAQDTNNLFDGTIDQAEHYRNFVADSDWQQAGYDASPKAGQVYFSQQAAENTQDTNLGPTTTASASGSGETINLSGSTTAATTTANATATGQTIFIEPDFATLDAAANATGGSISISGSTTVDVQTPAAATATGDDTLKITSNIFVGQAASASASGSAIKTDRLSGTVDVDDQPTGGVDINVVDKTNNILYETTTDSNGDWIVDSGDGILYQVAYLFDDGTTYYGDAEESDTT